MAYSHSHLIAICTPDRMFSLISHYGHLKLDKDTLKLTVTLKRYLKPLLSPPSTIPRDEYRTRTPQVLEPLCTFVRRNPPVPHHL
jgi:hypothetical protein